VGVSFFRDPGSDFSVLLFVFFQKLQLSKKILDLVRDFSSRLERSEGGTGAGGRGTYLVQNSRLCCQQRLSGGHVTFR